jgi:CheY-like chemotaxis protein
VADDNADAADTLAAVLRLAGHDVRIARDGREAVELAAAFRPALALLDIGMPGMNGYELARALRARPGTARTVLIAATGYGQEGDRDRAREAGFDHHIVKPVELRTVEAILTAFSAAAVHR